MTEADYIERGNIINNWLKLFRPTKPSPANPSDPDLRQQAVLLYYHDGAWEQAEIGGIYRAWSPAQKTNIEVVVVDR